MYSQITSNKRKSILLMVIFIAIILLLGWILSEVLDYGYGMLVFAIIFSLLMTLGSYYGGDKMALAVSGAKGPIKKGDNPYVYRMVENMAITAGVPMPKVYIIDDPAPNAFATGRDPKHASVAVTAGIIERLENEELEGVIAHELSHVKNYDIRVMTIVVVLVGIISILAQWFFRINLFGGRSRDNRGGGLIVIIGVLAIIISPIVAELIKLSISRKREYLADASGALLTRYPEGLVKALEKISAYTAPMKSANSGTAHLFFSNPFGKKGMVSKLFSTHPPIEERIRALRAML
ncbi:M48 family metallopeptidase [Patescibacteria group bacterium]|nr:M48 family metallopeptidase [Patescibacteria group bacterium]